MKKYAGFISIISGIIASVLVFTDLFKTPPIPITIFAIIGIVLGVIGLKTEKTTSIIGLLLSIISFGYLIYLFAGLGA